MGIGLGFCCCGECNGVIGNLLQLHTERFTWLRALAIVRFEFPLPLSSECIDLWHPITDAGFWAGKLNLLLSMSPGNPGELVWTRLRTTDAPGQRAPSFIKCEIITDIPIQNDISGAGQRLAIKRIKLENSDTGDVLIGEGPFLGGIYYSEIKWRGSRICCPIITFVYSGYCHGLLDSLPARQVSMSIVISGAAEIPTSGGRCCLLNGTFTNSGDIGPSSYNFNDDWFTSYGFGPFTSDPCYGPERRVFLEYTSYIGYPDQPLSNILLGRIVYLVNEGPVITGTGGGYEVFLGTTMTTFQVVLGDCQEGTLFTVCDPSSWTISGFCRVTETLGAAYQPGLNAWDCDCSGFGLQSITIY